MAYGIKEARANLPELVKRAAFEGEEIQLGVRGREQATLVATRALEALRRENQRLAAEVRELRGRVGNDEAAVAAPFAGLQARLDGQVSRPEVPPAVRERRLLPVVEAMSPVSAARRVALGSRGAEGPAFRRRTPRA